jgi:plastocyanin
MSNETLFYVCGVALAVSAVLVSFAGLKLKDFPGKAFPVVVLWFAILVGGATTFAVLHAKDEDQAKAAEFREANEEIEKEESSGPFEEASEEGEAEAEPEVQKEGGEESAKGGEEALQLAADTTALAYDTTSLSAKAGKVTIDFDNPSAIEHDVSIEADGKEIAKSELVTEGETSVTAELETGTYTFFCSVPGHRQAGMEGTLTVK